MFIIVSSGGGCSHTAVLTDVFKGSPQHCAKLGALMSVSASYAYAAPKTLVKQAVECHNMLFEERLEAAERRRRDGNALFQDGQYTEALGKYAMALSFVDEDFMMQLEGPHLQKAEAVIMPIHLNMAAVQIKLEDYQTAVWNCTQASYGHTTCPCCQQGNWVLVYEHLPGSRVCFRAKLNSFLLEV